MGKTNNQPIFRRKNREKRETGNEKKTLQENLCHMNPKAILLVLQQAQTVMTAHMQWSIYLSKYSTLQHLNVNFCVY